jgi:hypothetical protein
VTHSRATGAIRLVAASWLVVGAIRALADPWQAVAEQRVPMATLLPLTGISFTLGVFLLTGFMSRVCGLGLACLGAWQVASYGVNVIPVLEGLIGVHLTLRGGGAWATDIYVQRMQDRARRRAATLNSPESW